MIIYNSSHTHTHTYCIHFSFYKKGKEIFDLTKRITDLIPENNEYSWKVGYLDFLKTLT